MDEVEQLDIEISVLTPLELVGNTEDIEIGRDGLFLKHGYNQGLLLPQVATEQKWDREKFLQHTCMKAGLPTNAWKDEDIEIYKFSAIIFGEKDTSH